ncbi:MAG: hypothetical protein ABIJ86_01335, partial [Spirochaetota bacterium]
VVTCQALRDTVSAKLYQILMVMESVGVLRILRPGGFDSNPVHRSKLDGGNLGADYVICDDIDYPAGKALPLWLPGMGW